MVNVLLYARLSVSKDESVSIERQLDAGRLLAEARGWTVLDEFIDDGVSASKFKPEARPGWRDALNAVAAGDVHAVVIWKVDRLARRVLDFLNADGALQEHGAGLVCVADPIDMTTPQGRAFATMLAVFAELEAAALGARVRDAHRALIKAGRRSGGRPPYGWMNIANPQGPGLVLAKDPDRIAFVEEMVRRAQRGDTMYSIARWADAAGAPKRPHKNREHDSWGGTAVQNILRNPVLAGLTRYQPGRKSEAPDPWAVLRNDDGIPVVNESVAIMSVDERRSLLSLLDQRKASRGQQVANPTPLSRLLRCGTCGKTLHRCVVACTYPSYRCTNRECSMQVTVNQARAEEFVIAQAFAMGCGEMSIDDESDPIDNELAVVEEALHLATAALIAADDGVEVEQLTARIADLKSRQAEVRRTALKPKPILVVSSKWGTDFALAQELGDVAQQQRLIRKIIESVTVHSAGSRKRHAPLEGRVEIVWKVVSARRQLD